MCMCTPEVRTPYCGKPNCAAPVQQGAQQQDAGQVADPDLARLVNWFTFHPVREGQAARYEALREAARGFALAIVNLCPPSADRTVAIRHVRDAVMTANASIACEGR